MTKLLCVISTNPFEGSKVIEQLEAAMVAAVFEFEVSVLFIGNGVNCLVANQQGDLLGARSPSNLISGLAMYDVEKLYICAESIGGISIGPNMEIIDLVAQRALISAQDIVLGGAS
jgi:tRNA 2-thiouridine synthesizing protein C